MSRRKRRSQSYFVSPHIETAALEKIALLAEHKHQEREEERTYQQHIHNALDLLLQASRTENKIHLSVAESPDEKMLEQMKSNPAIISVELIDLNESDTQRVIDAISLNETIVMLYVKSCVLSIDAKNTLSLIFKNRIMKKIGFEHCGLDEDDIMWLQDMLKHAYAANSIAMIENLSQESYAQLYRQFPIANLRTIGLAPEQLEPLSDVLCISSLVDGLVLVPQSPIIAPQLDRLFSLIDTMMIRHLTMTPLHVTDEAVYKKLMQILRNNSQLLTLTIGYHKTIENDLFAMLLIKNSTLESIVIENPAPNIDQIKLDKIHALTHRNEIMNQARQFLGTLSLQDQTTADIESLREKSSKLCNSLSPYSDPSYISCFQVEIEALISMLSNLKEHPGNEKENIGICNA